MDPKRKLNGGVAAGEDDRTTKKRKTDDATIETPETTRDVGLKLIERVKNTKDSSKPPRFIAEAFLKLPSKRDHPDYYEVTKMPIALDTIEAKLKRLEFSNLTALESYFKRMVLNAKEYNEKGSGIHQDAERVRKAVANFMTDNNPAHRSPGFVTKATPLPGEEDAGSTKTPVRSISEAEVDSTPSKRRHRPSHNSQPHPLRQSATPALSEPNAENVGFSGLSMQQAQERIIEDIINQKDDEDDPIGTFEVFLELPPRKLVDYYQAIPNPMSLSVLLKKVRGAGKGGSIGSSEFKTWAAFEEETGLIWKNAKFYNEDGSEIFELASEMQIFFNKKLKEAKKAIPEQAAGTKIKLKVGEAPKIMLNLGRSGHKDTPAASPAAQINGSTSEGDGAARKNPLVLSNPAATPIQNVELEKARSISASVASPTPSLAAPIKNEEAARKSPSLAATNLQRPPSQGPPHAALNGMLPPSTTTPAQQYTSSGYAQSFNHSSQHTAPKPGFDSKFRRPGKNASDAMITNLSLVTHPGLNISKHFRMDLPPSPTMAQQSITITLPSTHYYLQIKPSIAASLLERQHKIFVTAGAQRLHALPTIPGHPVDSRHPMFEARLLPGVNRIELELIAALPKGAEKPASGPDVELEKITIFANLMR